MSPIVAISRAAGGVADASLAQAVAIGSGGSTSSSATPVLASTPTPGNLLLFCVAARDSPIGATVSGFTDMTGSMQGNGARAQGRWWRRIVQPGDGTSPATSPLCTFPTGYLIEFAWQNNGTINTNVSSNNTASTAPTVAAPTLGGSGPKWLEVMFGVGGTDGTGHSGNWTVGANWTGTDIVHQGDASSAFAPYAAVAYRTVASGGAFAGLLATPNEPWAMGIASFGA